MLSDKAAHVISAVISFPVISLVEFTALTILENPPLPYALLFLILHVVTPFTPPLIYSKVLKRGDIFVSKREDRIPLFMPGLLAYLVAAIFFKWKNYILIAGLELVSFTSTLILFIISFKWKISIHMASLTLPISYFTLVGYPQTLIFSLLVPLLAWARVKVKAHTPSQVLAGSIVGVLASLAFLLI
ncbi:MAG TPA: hypothetical protein ENF55_02280 [Thermoprotei archaeon]|nr:MAG: hypothetical protein DRJ63_07320 [Thermoprotei archaeon]HDI74763.1 hypothetical protein [Thermoprotei archaeon]